MKIEKNGKTYVIVEKEKTWTISRMDGTLSLSFNLKKIDYKTFEELTQFIRENDMF